MIFVDCRRRRVDSGSRNTRLWRGKSQWARTFEVRMRLLIVEDEARIAELVQGALARAGFAVDAVGLCAEARAALKVTSYDAAIVDLGLPDGDGLSLLRELRANGNLTPVLVLTARDAVEDRVRGLDTGADDYLVKPFALPELLARLRALARRGPAERPSILAVDDLVLDPSTREVRRGDIPIHLTPKEFVLLELFMRRAGEVLTRSAI